MTIDEAIKHAEQVAEEHESDLKVYESLGKDRPLFKKEENRCKECAEEHRQLAEWLKDYKRLLEQQPCEDSISRKAVFETIDDCNSDGLKGIFCSYVDGEKFKKYIKELPSVISKGVTVTDFADKCRECGKMKNGKWIPVSERLPKTNEYVGNVAKHYLIQDEFGDMEVAAYTTRGWIPIHTIEAFEYEVVAWMPLPKPYKAESEGEE